MYIFNDDQVDYILTDIKARGVEMEDLQQNLLDHICCVIEREAQPGEDFETVYKRAVKKFYNDALWEIEEETILLLSNKNYYQMKKLMILLGVLSVLSLTVGIFFKFMWWPGAALFIVGGILGASFLFLPLFCVLKLRDGSSLRHKLIISTGTFAGIMTSLAVLFRIQHWPGTVALGIAAVSCLLLLFLPIYFFTGIKDPLAKMNTIVTSMLLLIFAGLQLTLVSTPKAERVKGIAVTNLFLRTEKIVQTEKRQADEFLKTQGLSGELYTLSSEIFDLCADVKDFIVENETGFNKLGEDFEKQGAFLKDSFVQLFFQKDHTAVERVKSIVTKAASYNQLTMNLSQTNLHCLPTEYIYDQVCHEKTQVSLGMLTQLQLFVLQNEMEIGKDTKELSLVHGH